MPEPIAICIEDLDAHGTQARYTRCVAISGAVIGLSVKADGHFLWEKKEEGIAFELWVSADDQLILRRPENARSVRVHREGRFVDAPIGKPIVLLDQDQVSVEQRRYRVHVHGPAASVHGPSPLTAERSTRSGMTLAAAAIAMGAATVGCQKIDSGQAPDPKPTVSGMQAPQSGQDAQADVTVDSAGESDATDDVTDGETRDASKDGAVEAGAKKKPPIEIRHRPPAPVPSPRDPSDPQF